MRLRKSAGVAALVAAGLAAALAGCGGGGGSSTPVQTSPLSLSVQWGARSRAIAGPSSALSAVVRIPGGKPDGSDYAWVLNRHADPAAYTQTYTSTGNPARVGTFNVTATFYAQADGAGDAVGVAQQQATIAADGTGLDNITTTNKVASVTVAPNQSLNTGETKDLQVTAHDASNNVIAVTPGSIFLNSDKTSVVAVTGNQQVQAAGTGTANVTATIDGVASAATAVSVNPNLNTLKSPVMTNTQLDAVNNLMQHLAQVQNIPSVSQQLQAAQLAPLAGTLATQANGYIDQVKNQTPTRKRSPGDTWTYTTSSGGFTVTVSLTEGVNSAFDWKVTLNGAAGGVTYNNFDFLVGSSRPDTLTGRSGVRSTLAFNSPPVGGQPATQVANWDIFSGNDGTADGTFSFGAARATLKVDAAKTFTMAAVDSNNVKSGDISIAADGSGTAHSYCGQDGAIESVTTFNALAQSGSVVSHATACGGTEGTTSSWP